MKCIKFFCTILILIFSTWVNAARVEIIFWHSLAGHLGSQLQELIKGFNQSQQEYWIKPIYKGEYTDTLTSFAAAFKAHHPPALIQVFEVGSGVMLSPKGIIKPFYELFSSEEYTLLTQDFLPTLLSFYSFNGKLQALPFNISIPILYYNADILKEIGIKAENFPKTWDELEKIAAILKKKGYRCIYTSAYPSWIQIESFSALHDLPFIDKTKDKAIFNHLGLIKHLTRLKKWQKQHYFEYGGRASDATSLFISNRCIMFSQSSGNYNSLDKLTNFKLGATLLPLENSLTSTRKANVAGGAALWAVAGQTKETYAGIAQFYAYLLKPKIQQQWHQETGYIPIGLTGKYAFIDQKNTNPILSLAQIDLAIASKQQSGLSYIPLNQIRMINDEVLEAIFADIKSPAIALNEAVNRTNFTLKRFSRNSQN